MDSLLAQIRATRPLPQSEPTGWLKRWLHRRAVRKLLDQYGHVAWCPGCDCALTGHAVWALSEWSSHQGTYRCDCGRVSRWAFGIIPGPLLAEGNYAKAWQECPWCDGL